MLKIVKWLLHFIYYFVFILLLYLHENNFGPPSRIEISDLLMGRLVLNFFELVLQILPMKASTFSFSAFIHTFGLKITCMFAIAFSEISHSQQCLLMQSNLSRVLNGLTNNFDKVIALCLCN